MKRFFLNVGILSGAVTLTVAAVILILLPSIRNANDYLGASIEKEKRLIDTKAPKLILVGGSNLTFGINSELIEQQFNIPVVNMSLQAGLGLAFALNEALDGVRDSDIVLLSTEYYLDKPEMSVVAELLAANPGDKKYIHFSYPELVDFYIGSFQSSVTEIERKIAGNIKKRGSGGSDGQDDIYRRDGFNAEGDLISHLNKKNLSVRPFSLIGGDYSDGIVLLNTFVTNARKKGARVYYLFPTLQESSFRSNQKQINDFANVLKNRLACSIINTPQTFSYSDSLYFNTAYHLNGKGRDIRTRKLIDILNAAVFN